MLEPQLTPFHYLCAVFGIFTTLLTFVSFLVKERFFISDSLLSYLVGVVVGPAATGLFNVHAWTSSAAELESVTLEFTRLSLCIQVILAGIQLPPRFAKHAWRSMLTMLLPGMVCMWLISSLLVWAICVLPQSGEDSSTTTVRRMPFLHALAIGSCLAPTDPILASTIIKGRWADEHVPAPLAQIISGESGANDGLGYPFLFLALYLIAYVGGDGQYAATEGGASTAMAHFFGNTVAFVVLLGAVWGGLAGYVCAKVLRMARRLHYVDQESFFAFPVLLAIFLIGTCGLAGSDDILAAFVAGNALSWTDWFRHETANDSFGTTVDMFLNVALFIYLGAVCPWGSFQYVAASGSPTMAAEAVLPLWRLVCLALAILALRRLPVLLAFHKLGLLEPHVKTMRQAAFMGFFGPMGVSSIFYVHEILRFCRKDLSGDDGTLRPDVQYLPRAAETIVWFIVTCSIVVHGLAIPTYQMGVAVWMQAWPGNREHPERHHYSFKGFVQRESYALHSAWEKFEEGEHHAVEQLEAGLQRRLRARPGFRQIKSDAGSQRGEW
ncbi:uncharacterized protein J7T54_007924 [Emericellopsis cladophorae]|uniref:Cation/H+ exchanger transmembrane domain-containing protein n=1 Tax=Emericellopsis cladophorae TaxID=2686198 RepID=A0A9P9Y7F4_9HYPO|nr:uncharacterized protein J7T54_007924 [Emericellopsis cladophorae]KAI6784831.1 hypothetical protein J7T54_007924 [Emericellopsis cladophorae]